MTLVWQFKRKPVGGSKATYAARSAAIVAKRQALDSAGENWPSQEKGSFCYTPVPVEAPRVWQPSTQTTGLVKSRIHMSMLKQRRRALAETPIYICAGKLLEMWRVNSFPGRQITQVTPLKINMEHNHGGLVQIIFFSKLVISR